MKKHTWWRQLFLRRAIVSVLILMQVAFIAHMLLVRSQASMHMAETLHILSFALSIHIINSKVKSGYRIVWLLLIFIAPVIGIPFYLLFRLQSGSQRLNRKIKEIEFRASPSFLINPACYDRAKIDCDNHLAGLNYLQNFTRFPVCNQTQTQFYSPGEDFLEALLPDLMAAQRYIFLEYFIISEGEMWSKIVAILEERAKAGLDVRVLYDDMGCFLSLPPDFATKLNEKGIKTMVFSPFSPFISSVQNNRDHRKICSIDGKVAYTGGINLADEYINHIDKHGHWKDCAIRLDGLAAWNLTVIFLEMWELTCRKSEEYFSFYPWLNSDCETPSDGYVLPYADSPMDDENVGEHVYLQIINSAKRYLYICSPYLIIDDALVTALTLAAKSGVDVRIITPDRADKRFVHFTTQSYYRELLAAGISIYQYTDGFMHSKTFVSDDVVATVGTTNMDYRSLYLNFECGVWLYGSKAVMQVKNDFLETLEKCHKIDSDSCRCSGIRAMWQEILRIFAPLM